MVFGLLAIEVPPERRSATLNLVYLPLYAAGIVGPAIGAGVVTASGLAGPFIGRHLIGSWRAGADGVPSPSGAESAESPRDSVSRRGPSTRRVTGARPGHLARTP